MSDADSSGASIEQVCETFEQQLRSGDAPTIETVASTWLEVERNELITRLIQLEVSKIESDGDPVDWQDYRKRFPGLVSVIDQLEEESPMPTVDIGFHVCCPHCKNPLELVEDQEQQQVECTTCQSTITVFGANDSLPGLAVGDKVAHFELRRVLGRGAFGTVWQAHDSELDRRVALKIPRHGQVDPNELGGFLREAQATAQLDHPNIVSVHQISRDNGRAFIVSDLVDGVTLEEWLKRGITVRESVEMLIKICRALDHAHKRGIVHRDLKPTNIMVDSSGEPRVMDFGLAKRQAAEITMTFDGAVLGTPAYMPPEQVTMADQADARSDVYSLGVILFKMLTGELPFRGDIKMLMHQVRFETPPSPRTLATGLERDIETICLKCLEKKPESRYGSAEELGIDLERYLNGESIAARPPGVFELFLRWYPKHAVTIVASFWLVNPVAGILIWLGALFFAKPNVGSLEFLASNLLAAGIGYLALRFGRAWLWVTVPFMPIYYWLAVKNIDADYGRALAMPFGFIALLAVLLAIGALAISRKTLDRMPQSVSA